MLFDFGIHVFIQFFCFVLRPLGTNLVSGDFSLFWYVWQFLAKMSTFWWIVNFFGDPQKWEAKSTPLDRTWFTPPISRTWKIVLRSFRLGMKRKRLETAFWHQNWTSDLNEEALCSELAYSTSFLGRRLRRLFTLWNEIGVILGRSAVEAVIS